MNSSFGIGGNGMACGSVLRMHGRKVRVRLTVLVGREKDKIVTPFTAGINACGSGLQKSFPGGSQTIASRP